MSQLRYYFFGPFQVTRDDKNVLGCASDKMRALLAYLIVEADRPHHREALAALLWPDDTDIAARRSLRQALYVVRHALSESHGERRHGLGGLLDCEEGAGRQEPPNRVVMEQRDQRAYRQEALRVAMGLISRMRGRGAVVAPDDPCRELEGEAVRLEPVGGADG